MGIDKIIEQRENQFLFQAKTSGTQMITQYSTRIAK